MMIIQKYATAFLNVYDSYFKPDDIIHLEEVARYLYNHRRALFLLQVPEINAVVKREGLSHLMNRFSVPDIIMQLVDLLLHNGRTEMIAAILMAIVEQYRRNHDLYYVRVSSAISLSQDDRQSLESIIDQLIKGIKNYDYTVNPSLIAGIRIETDMLLWEYSIDKQLRDIKRIERW